MRKSRRLRLTPLMFGIGASHWVAITCLPVLLFGCTAATIRAVRRRNNYSGARNNYSGARHLSRHKRFGQTWFSRPQSREK